ncbi:hypothetical protein Rctr85_046 [Virus Rctr85]|nr:hypothetical protein Rctr85_046 [Virus Rctr85]
MNNPLYRTIALALILICLIAAVPSVSWNVYAACRDTAADPDIYVVNSRVSGVAYVEDIYVDVVEESGNVAQVGQSPSIIEKGTHRFLEFALDVGSHITIEVGISFTNNLKRVTLRYGAALPDCDTVLTVQPIDAPEVEIPTIGVAGDSQCVFFEIDNLDGGWSRVEDANGPIVVPVKEGVYAELIVAPGGITDPARYRAVLTECPIQEE